MRKNQIIIDDQGEESLIKYTFTYQGHTYAAASSHPYQKDAVYFREILRDHGRVIFDYLSTEDKKIIPDIYRQIEKSHPLSDGEHYAVEERIQVQDPLILKDEIAFSAREMATHMIISMIMTAFFAFLAVDNMLMTTAIDNTLPVKLMMIVLSGVFCAINYYDLTILGDRRGFIYFMYGQAALLVPYLFLTDVTTKIGVFAYYAIMIVYTIYLGIKKGGRRNVYESEPLSAVLFIALIFAMISVGIVSAILILGL